MCKNYMWFVFKNRILVTKLVLLFDFLKFYFMRKNIIILFCYYKYIILFYFLIQNKTILL